MAALSLALALGTGGVGCRGILGIDDGSLAPSASEEAGPGTEAGQSLDDGGARDGAPAETSLDAGVTAVDRRFAQWPLPPPAPLLSQYDLAPDTVTDKITGLVWQRNDSDPATMSFPAGVAYCDGLTMAGQSDWRVPTRIELLTILDYGQPSGLLNPTVFPGGAQSGAPSIAWTASLSLLRAKLDDRMNLDMLLGNVNVTDIAQSSLLVKCVRGGPVTSPVDRFVVGSGTARDVRTGLLWQTAPIATTQSFTEAGASCAQLSLGGFASGWRLPTVRELASLVDESREQSPLLPPMFLAGPSAKFWSATPRKNPATASYAVDFATANVTTQELTLEKHSARCVR